MIQQFLLYPQVTGEIKIDPVQISVLVQQKIRESQILFWRLFFNISDSTKGCCKQPVKIKVKPLPGVQPADFSGVVGKLDLKATLNKESVNVNDAVNFKVTISGNGNLKIAAAPVLKLSPDIEVYDPKITDDLKNGLNGTPDRKVLNIL